MWSQPLTQWLVSAPLTGPWCHVSYLERPNFLAKVLGRAPGDRRASTDPCSLGRTEPPSVPHGHCVPKVRP